MLLSKLRTLIPGLLEANGYPDYGSALSSGQQNQIETHRERGAETSWVAEAVLIDVGPCSEKNRGPRSPLIYSGLEAFVTMRPLFLNGFRRWASMRLSAAQIEAIKQEAEHYFGSRAEVWLFGSRVDDKQRGGDVDLYVESGMRDADQLVRARFAFLAQLKRRIGDGKIDLVLQREGGEVLPIYEIAKQHGVRL